MSGRERYEYCININNTLVRKQTIRNNKKF